MMVQEITYLHSPGKEQLALLISQFVLHLAKIQKNTNKNFIITINTMQSKQYISSIIV